MNSLGIAVNRTSIGRAQAMSGNQSNAGMVAFSRRGDANLGER